MLILIGCEGNHVVDYSCFYRSRFNHNDLSILYDITGLLKRLVFHHRKNDHARKKLRRQWYPGSLSTLTFKTPFASICQQSGNPVSSMQIHQSQSRETDERPRRSLISVLNTSGTPQYRVHWAGYNEGDDVFNNKIIK